MDIAADICAGEHARSRVATVAIDAMSFVRPKHVGDVLCVYAEIVGEGRSSMKIHLEAWAKRGHVGRREKATGAQFTFVALDEQGGARPLPESGLRDILLGRDALVAEFAAAYRQERLRRGRGSRAAQARRELDRVERGIAVSADVKVPRVAGEKGTRLLRFSPKAGRADDNRGRSHGYQSVAPAGHVDPRDCA